MYIIVIGKVDDLDENIYCLRIMGWSPCGHIQKSRLLVASEKKPWIFANTGG